VDGDRGSRSRAHARAFELDELSPADDPLAAPEGPDDLECLVEPADALARPAAPEAEGAVARLAPDRDEQAHPPRVESPQGGQRLGEPGRIPVVDEPQRRHLDALGSRQQLRGHRVPVEHVGVPQAGDHRDVAVDEDHVVAEGLGLTRELEQGLEGQAVPAEGDAEPQPRPP
jgi:hypothetical protein